MVTLDRKDWQRSIQISKTRYDSEKVTNKNKTVDSKISPANFRDVGNMHAFVEQTAVKFKDKNSSRLNVLKTKINNEPESDVDIKLKTDHGNDVDIEDQNVVETNQNKIRHEAHPR